MTTLLLRWHRATLRPTLAKAGAAVWAARAEALAAIAVLAGWALLWWGLGDVLSRWLPARGIWAIGLGVFLLSCFGWKMLRTLAVVGLYALSKADEK